MRTQCPEPRPAARGGRQAMGHSRAISHPHDRAFYVPGTEIASIAQKIPRPECDERNVQGTSQTLRVGAPAPRPRKRRHRTLRAGGLARRARSIPDLSSACWAGAAPVRTERASGVQASRRASDRCTWQGAGRGRRSRIRKIPPLGGKYLLSPLEGEWFCSFSKENLNQRPKSPMFRTLGIVCCGT